MQTIYKYTVPGFLRRLDGYLLEQYPVLWRTRAHYVLFYALSAAVLLFAAGFFAPVSAVHLQVDPIRPIELFWDTQNQYTLIIVLICSVGWFSSQYDTKFSFTKPIHVLFTLFIYTFCFWALIGVTASAFRVGEIYRTAWAWIDEQDLEYLESSEIYPIGIVLPDTDTFFTSQSQVDSFFKHRETIFRDLCKSEDTILLHRYDKDSSYWNSLLKQSSRELVLYNSYLSDRKYNSHRLYMTYPLDQSYVREWINRSYLFTESTQYNTDRQLLSKIFNIMDLSDITDISNLLSQSKKYSARNQVYQFFRANTTKNRINLLKSIGSKEGTLFRLLEYNKRITNKHQQCSPQLISKYNFLTTLDTLRATPKLTFIWPNFSYSVESSIRSVKNARLFFEKGVWVQHLLLSLQFVPFFSFFLFSISFALPRHLLFAFIILVLMRIIFNPRLIEVARFVEGDRSIWLNTIAFLFIPVISFSYLLVSVFKKRQNIFVPIMQNLLFIGVFITLFAASDFLKHEIRVLGHPYDPAFYGAQILGISGAFLMAYARTLPKTK